MKKFLSLVLALVMTMSLVTVSAGAKDFTDNDKITYEEAVAVMSEVGVIDGYTDGSFNPTATLTRGAAAKIICNLILGPTTASALVADAAPYSDVPTDNVFAGYIAYCQKTGIISGYADGTFRPANSLTGYAFMKMLLGALGYDAAVEGYSGDNWSINVAKRALNVGLNKGLVDSFNGVKAVTREEACLYAFNTLKATMVEYDTVITVGEITIAGSKANEMVNSARVETIKDDGKMQFAEKYFADLKQTKTESDDFGRPAHEWKFKKNVIGLYTETPDLTYTETVKGKEIRSDLGENYEIDAYYVNGKETALPTGFEVVKNNAKEMGGNGVLTEVFVIDNGDKDDTLVITRVDTYLAQATADYSTKNENVKLAVYNKVNGDTVTKTVKLDDVDTIKGIEKDDFVLVTMANGAVKSVEAAEAAEGVTITTFSTNDGTTTASGTLLKKVTFEGTKYDANVNAYYDIETLTNYADELLEDNTFNVYMDKYGYVIGVEAVDADAQYVFVTSYDAKDSVLSKVNDEATVIFTDGTMKTVEIKQTKTLKAALAESEISLNDNKTVNVWFEYSMDDDVVVLEKVVEKQLTDRTTTAINGKSTTLKKADNEYKFGNAESVYIAAEVDDDNTAWVVDVNGVYTGIKNVDIDLTVSKKVDEQTNAYGVAYAMYNDKGYVTYAVVVGEDASSSDNYVYITSTNVVDKTYIDKDTGYVYTYDCIIDGEMTTVQMLKKVAQTLSGNTLYKVTYDANGYGKKAEVINSTSTALVNTQYLKDNTVYGRYGKSMNFTVKGGTLYIWDNNDNASYVVLDDTCNFWVKNTDEANGGNNKWEEFDDIDAALAELGDSGKTLDKGTFAVIADKDSGYATTIIFFDTAYDKEAEDDDDADTSAIVVTLNADNSVTVSNADDAKLADILSAIEAKIEDADYIVTEKTIKDGAYKFTAQKVVAGFTETVVYTYAG